MSKKKITLVIVLAIIFGTLVSLIIFSISKYRQVVVTVNHSKNSTISPTPTPTPDPNAPFSILLMGYGGGAHQGGTLTDSIIVAQFIPKEQKIKLISVPRDLWVPIPVSVGETKMSKVNAAYSIGLDDRKYPDKEVQFTGKAGGGEMSKTIISQIVGFPINNFITINFDAFTKTIDTLGGVDVNVQKTFDDPYYPLEVNIDDTCGKSDDEIKSLEATMSGDKLDNMFACRYESLHFDKGLQHMDGVTALKFVRSRHSVQDGGDFNRAARQKLVIEAVKKKIISLNFVPKLISFVNTLAGNLTTDIDLDQMQKLISKSSEYQNYKIESVALTDQNVLMDTVSSDRQAILTPKLGINNWADIQSFIATSSSSKLLN
jgi:LCP family protein required for cell wall assembly